MSNSQESRNPRRDKGRITPTPRDLAVLTWTGEQYTARLDQVARLLGRDPQRETQQAGIVGMSTAQRVVRRWLAAELVRCTYLIAREPPWISLTYKGQREVGLSFREYTPTAAMAKHHYWTNQVRLWFEQQYPADYWISERLLEKGRKGRAEKALHLADAEIQRTNDGEPTMIAVEVELTIKSAQRSEAIMSELSERYDGIWYFTNAITHDAVQRTVMSLPEEAREKFRIRDLSLTQ